MICRRPLVLQKGISWNENEGDGRGRTGGMARESSRPSVTSCEPAQNLGEGGKREEKAQVNCGRTVNE